VGVTTGLVRLSLALLKSIVFEVCSGVAIVSAPESMRLHKRQTIAACILIDACPAPEASIVPIFGVTIFRLFIQ
jgi:hypothetical protein